MKYGIYAIGTVACAMLGVSFFPPALADSAANTAAKGAEGDICDISGYAPSARGDSLLNKPIVLLGEIRGTAEAPMVAAELVCRAAVGRKRVLLAIEAPDNASPYVLDANQREKMRENLVARTEDFWLTHPDVPARTQALKFMIEWLMGTAESADKNIRLMNIDLPAETDRTELVSRNWYMADHIKDRFHSEEYDQIFVLTADDRARVKRTDQQEFTGSISEHLPTDSFVSIALYPSSGSYWACDRSGCGIRELSTERYEEYTHISLKPAIATQHGWHGVIQFAEVSASPPVERLD